jgi:hypothetical protein
VCLGTVQTLFYHVLKYALKENSLPLCVRIFHAVQVDRSCVTRSRDGPFTFTSNRKNIIMSRRYMSGKTMAMNTMSGWDEDY